MLIRPSLMRVQLLKTGLESRRLVSLAAVCLAVLAPVVRARPALAEPAAAAPSADALLAIKSRLRAFETLHGRFEQEKRLAKIKKPLKSRGRFVLKRGQGVLWQTDAPLQSLLALNRDSVRVLKSDRTVMSISLSAQPGLRLMGKIVFAVFAADVEEIRQSFEIVRSRTQADAPWEISLKPRDATVAKVIAEISLGGTAHVETLDITERNGDVTHIHFTDFDSSTPLSEQEMRLLNEGSSKK